jgi:outer membrane protein assembly factor BamB
MRNDPRAPVTRSNGRLILYVFVIGNAAGALWALDPKDGSAPWSHHFKGIITSTGSSGDVLYVGTQEGTVFAVRRPK